MSFSNVLHTAIYLRPLLYDVRLVCRQPIRTFVQRENFLVFDINVYNIGKQGIDTVIASVFHSAGYGMLKIPSCTEHVVYPLHEDRKRQVILDV